MAFIFYSLAVGILVLAYEQPDMFMIVIMLYAAKLTLWGAR